MSRPLFGPAGSTDRMKDFGVKKSLDIPQYLKNMGLTAFEYQCGHGVAISLEAASAFGQVCKAHGIIPSVHAPYFISLSSVSEETRIKSVEYIRKTAAVAKAMGGKRIVVHSGSCGKMAREEALILAKDTLALAVKALLEDGTECVSICPETMGKINQLGDLDEVMELCKVSESFIPCIDFGHLNARTHGGIASKEDYALILDKIENALGYDRLKNMHCHFSKIEYSEGGEKRHLTFEDSLFGPDFNPLAEEIARRGLTPTLICESAGTQDVDALEMSRIYSQYERNGQR